PRFTTAQLDTMPPQHVPEGVSVLKFESPLHFANVTLFTDKISELIASVKEDSLLNGRAIVVDCTAMAYVDNTVLDIIKNDDILQASIPVLALRRSVNEALLYLAAQPNA
ncbi:STAS domain protein, partial [Teladorsagia circumcincta]